jgi:hypothetical protein
MPPVGFEPKIPASARPQTYALDRAATGIGTTAILQHYKHKDDDTRATIQEDETDTDTLTAYQSPSIVQIPTDLIHSRGKDLRAAIHKHINCIWNKEDLIQQQGVYYCVTCQKDVCCQLRVTVWPTFLSKRNGIPRLTCWESSVCISHNTDPQITHFALVR